MTAPAPERKLYQPKITLTLRTTKREKFAVDATSDNEHFRVLACDIHKRGIRSHIDFIGAAPEFAGSIDLNLYDCDNRLPGFEFVTHHVFVFGDSATDVLERLQRVADDFCYMHWHEHPSWKGATKP